MVRGDAEEPRGLSGVPPTRENGPAAAEWTRLRGGSSMPGRRSLESRSVGAVPDFADLFAIFSALDGSDAGGG